jgi:macrocin-O-methyltransferase TylF-like protien
VVSRHPADGAHQAVLRLDGDMYETTMDALRSLIPRAGT